MSGHSKWSSIKHKKSRVDAQRGKVFSKLIKEITVAARLGGGDVDSNSRLRTIVQQAKAENMPAANIERAIKKGTGELPGVSYEEAVYEGYGPSGIAVMVEALTDNRNRTTADLRHLFGKNGGSLGEVGCVAWMFEQKGLIILDPDKYNEDDLFIVALEAGAEDIKTDDPDLIEIITAITDFDKVKSALDEQGIRYEESSLGRIPRVIKAVEDKREAEKVLNLIEALEDHDDVQRVYANFDIAAPILENFKV